MPHRSGPRTPAQFRRGIVNLMLYHLDGIAWARANFLPRNLRDIPARELRVLYAQALADARSLADTSALARCRLDV